MTIALALIGVVLVAVGVVFLRRPTILRRGMWMHTSIAIRALSERDHVRYVRGVGALQVVLGAALLSFLAGSPPGLYQAIRPSFGSERGRLEVLVDPTITDERALRVGENPRAPIFGVDTAVAARREADGALAIDVRVVRNDVWFGSRFVLCGEPGRVEVEARSHSAQGDSAHYRWPSRDLRGSITLNHDRLADLTGRPLVVHSDVTGWRSGSDVHEALAIVVTEADLR